MTIAEAVELARSGREAGYRYLYETTYKSKYYLALQYMKNEDDAQDVIQDAYIIGESGKAGGVFLLAGKDRRQYREKRPGKKESHFFHGCGKRGSGGGFYRSDSG